MIPMLLGFISLGLFFFYNLWRNDVARPWFIPIAKDSLGKLVAVNTLNGNVDYFYCENLGGMVQYRPQVLHRSYLIFSKGSETQKRILRDTLKQYWPDIYDDLYKI